MFKTILVAVDGSDHATKAAKAGASLAARLNARLVFVHVLMTGASAGDIRAVADLRKLPKTLRDELDALDMPVAAAAMGAGFVTLPAPQPVLKAVGEQILERARGVAGKARVRRVDAVLVEGDPSEAIMKRAKREKADLLVVGSRGHGMIEELVLGSVSRDLAHQSKLPCLIVK